jgi:hypothetical protein
VFDQRLILEGHPALLLLAALVGILIPFWLYYKSTRWGKKLKIFLGFLRFASVFLICSLLLDPRLIQTKSREEKPLVTFVIDQSKSMSLHLDSPATLGFWQRVNQLKTDLETRGVQVDFLNLEGKSPETTFSGFKAASSDLDQALKSGIQKKSTENLQHLVLFSDGVFNKGYNPADRIYSVPVSCIGIGDTTPIVDTYIDELTYNRQVYSKNEFEVSAYVSSMGLSKEELLPLQVRLNGQLVKESMVRLAPNAPASRLDFTLPGQNPGVYLFELSLGRVAGEKIPQNNFSNLYVEVVESKTRILLAAASPHPDLQAIRSAAEELDQVELKVVIAGVNPIPNGPFDLVIYHQIPHTSGVGNDLMRKEQWDQQALWFITGAATQFNALQNTPAPALVKIKGLNADLARLIPNPSFRQIDINSVFLERLPELPPIAVPFADQQLKPNAEVVFYQKIGLIETERPLLSISQSYPKRALWTGDGLWSLRMQEYSTFGSTEGFDSWMAQWLQLLAAKEDKRKLRLYPSKSEYQEGDEIKVKIEAFNDILEPMFGTTVALELSRKESVWSNNYQFTLSPGQDDFNPGPLSQGIYILKAESMLNGKLEKATAKFIVKDLQTELSNRVADYENLRATALGNGGIFYPYTSWDKASDEIKKLELLPLLHTEETETRLIEELWLLLLIIGLISTEWLIRKLKGIY